MSLISRPDIPSDKPKKLNKRIPRERNVREKEERKKSERKSEREKGEKWKFYLRGILSLLL